MKVSLDFEGYGAELRMTRVALEQDVGGPRAKPLSELFDAALADRSQLGSLLFQWRSTARAFAHLVLAAYANGRPFEASLEGRSGSLARSLVELLGDKRTKSDEPTWLQRLFAPLTKAGVEGARVPPSLFVFKGNSTADVFQVSLGPSWRDAELQITWNHAPVKSPEAAGTMAQLLREQHQPGGRKAPLPRLTGAIELLFWEPRESRYLPSAEGSLPARVQAGVAVRLRLSRPAYPYVVWITSTGLIQPLYPWKDLRWRGWSKTAALTELALPDALIDAATGFYPLASPPGTETVLLLASEQPPAAAVARGLETRLRRVAARARLTLPDGGRVFPLADPRTASPNPGALRLGRPQKITDPTRGLADAVLSEVGFAFPCLAGAAFLTTSDRP